MPAKSSPLAAFGALAALGIFFLGVLILGWIQGELWLPTRGFHTVLVRAVSPFGFYILATFYLALAAACGYLLYLLFSASRSERGASTTPTPGTLTKASAPMNLDAQFSISQDGRGGNIVATTADGIHTFWWEFGGGDCIAFIDVPDESQWMQIPALAALPRAQFLENMARVVGNRQCPGASYRVGARSIEYFSSVPNS